MQLPDAGAADRSLRPAAAGRMRLALLSFLMLFVELALIRWIGSNVIYLSYFSNFVLLGSFLGIGVGFLRATARPDLFALAPAILTVLVAFVLLFPVTVACGGGQIIFFGCRPSGLPMWVVLPVLFCAVTAAMAAIGQGVARAFADFEPLEAYRLDILGSLAGIVAFTLLALADAPPLAWASVVALAFAVLYGRAITPLQLFFLASLVILLGVESLGSGARWSPYYKITVAPKKPGVSVLSVNGIPHQVIESVALRRADEPLYFVPYRRLAGNPLASVLIVGAGNGSDIAIALAAGAKHIDAVEIDPEIAAIGRALNPDRPYANPAVSVHIDDGRAFLQNARARYDLIIFALPDSLSLVSGQSSLRLESYLFTSEAMATARAHLTPAGAFVMYNYYRQPWLLDRLARTLDLTYGHAPCSDSVGGSGNRFSLLTIGLRAGAVRCAGVWNPGNRVVPAPADDDHPFLYLQTRSIPALYALSLAIVALLAVGIVRIAGGPLRPMGAYLDLFFMGAAFLLLETKNVVQFALLFGTTWLVNALVFAGVLVCVLLAIEIASRVRFARPEVLFIALFAALSLAWAIPPQALLGFDAPLRFVLAVALAFAPIVLANLIFAQRFRDTAASTVAFGANLLGAMVGGMLEYGSLIVGYRALLPIVALLYALAFITSRKPATVSS
jgi:hypothetical protein